MLLTNDMKKPKATLARVFLKFDSEQSSQWVDPTYTFMLQEMLHEAPSVDQSSVSFFQFFVQI